MHIALMHSFQQQSQQPSNLHSRQRSTKAFAHRLRALSYCVSRPADEDNDDGDGDYVPRATTMRLRGTSPAPAPRRSAGARLRTRSSSNGGIATTAAAAAAAGSAVEAGNAGISGDGAAPRQGDAEASDGSDGARGPARVKVAPAELHESRSGSPADRSPADGDYDALQQVPICKPKLSCVHATPSSDKRFGSLERL